MDGIGTLLLVNDNEDLTDTLRLFFELKGHVVAVAPNGRAALDLLDAGLRPSLIVLDLMMPVMSGAEFRARQLQHAEYGRIPVVLVSVRTDVVDSVAALGAVGYARLPGELDRLVELVETYCGVPAERG